MRNRPLPPLLLSYGSQCRKRTVLHKHLSAMCSTPDDQQQNWKVPLLENTLRSRSRNLTIHKCFSWTAFSYRASVKNSRLSALRPALYIGIKSAKTDFTLQGAPI